MDGELPDRIPAHPPMPAGASTQAPQRHILMTPHMAAVGGLIAFFSVVAMVVVLPTATYNPPPSSNWLPLSDAETRGRALYLANGCVYCHSGFSRPQDVFNAQYYLYPRASEPGDYRGVSQSPNILGSERTGPDLSQEGGNHPDDWHVAHYDNPRSVNPLSIMPRFNFWSRPEVADVIAFNQSAGGKEAVLRTVAVRTGQALMKINMGMLDPAAVFPGLAPMVRPDGAPDDISPWGMPWKAVWHMNSFERSYWLTSNPLPVTEQNLLRGKAVFIQRCTGCHGIQGDGSGPAASFLMPKPFDFTDAKEMAGPGASDGQMYHRILTAGPGTAMENFGTRLSVEDIWRVVLFLRTIPNGSLRTPETVPTTDMWSQWTPPPPILRYLGDHPIERGPGSIVSTRSDPFLAAAQWVAPGLAEGDEVLVGGKLPMTLRRLADEIRAAYLRQVEAAYAEAQARGERLPPKEQVMATSGVTFHAP